VAGQVEVSGKPVKPSGPRTMMNAGVGLLTEDRKVLGLLPELSIRENVTIASLRSGSAVSSTRRCVNTVISLTGWTSA
jgi:ribose transport system ATP-binding protein/rhamnose transport system ATP-binding protein